jgi:hypothetical protein
MESRSAYEIVLDLASPEVKTYLLRVKELAGDRLAPNDPLWYALSAEIMISVEMRQSLVNELKAALDDHREKWVKDAETHEGNLSDFHLELEGILSSQVESIAKSASKVKDFIDALPRRIHEWVRDALNTHLPTVLAERFGELVATQAQHATNLIDTHLTAIAHSKLKDLDSRNAVTKGLAEEARAAAVDLRAAGKDAADHIERRKDLILWIGGGAVLLANIVGVVGHF